jgi:hypothetical protein
LKSYKNLFIKTPPARIDRYRAAAAASVISILLLPNSAVFDFRTSHRINPSPLAGSVHNLPQNQNGLRYKIGLVLYFNQKQWRSICPLSPISMAFSSKCISAKANMVFRIFTPCTGNSMAFFHRNIGDDRRRFAGKVTAFDKRMEYTIPE